MGNRVEQVAIDLCRGKTLIGQTHSVGPYAGDAYLFAVRAAEHGCPVVLAHDAFFAADWFVRLERGEDIGEVHVLRQPSPAEESAQYRQQWHEKRPHVIPMLDAWLSWHRDIRGCNP